MEAIIVSFIAGAIFSAVACLYSLKTKEERRQEDYDRFIKVIYDTARDLGKSLRCNRHDGSIDTAIADIISRLYNVR